MKNEIKKGNVPVCTGACLFGECPYKECVRHLGQVKKTVQAKTEMNILVKSVLPSLSSDKSGYGIAVDIGTTTVVMYLYDMETVGELGCVSRLNAQTTMGLDVISRIQYSTDQQTGLSLLNEAIVTQLNDMLNKITTQQRVDLQAVTHMVITGNTTMLHLLANISPAAMGVSPFTPETLFGQHYHARELGLQCEKAKTYLSPCISAFVGGDITSAILASGMFEREDLCVLLDIGTNGEVVLGNKHGIVATSTAAGPAFEGAHITCGMAGVPGAINSVEAYQGRIEVTTINDEPAKGICGSGLLDAVALMLNIGVLDESGRIKDASEVNQRLKEYITQVDGEKVFKIYGDIVLSQKDIREVQMAKAAIAAGVQSLLHHTGNEIYSIKEFFLAGGFGNFLNKQSAMRVGLLPYEAAGKIHPIGNAAGSGAIMTLLSNNHLEQCQSIAKAGVHVELGHNPYFMDQYVSNMMFQDEDH